MGGWGGFAGVHGCGGGGYVFIPGLPGSSTPERSDLPRG